MYARVSFYDLGGTSRDDALGAFEQSRGAIEQMQGVQGAMLLVDPQGDRALTITFWESEEALRATEQAADETRRQAASTAGMTIRDVQAYEVALEFGR